MCTKQFKLLLCLFLGQYSYADGGVTSQPIGSSNLPGRGAGTPPQAGTTKVMGSSNAVTPKGVGTTERITPKGVGIPEGTPPKGIVDKPQVGTPKVATNGVTTQGFATKKATLKGAPVAKSDLAAVPTGTSGPMLRSNRGSVGSKVSKRHKTPDIKKVPSPEIPMLFGEVVLDGDQYVALSIHGSCSFKELMVTETLKTVGILDGHGLKSKKLVVHGLTTLSDSVLGELHSKGVFKGKNLQVRDKSVFLGAVRIKNSTLKKLIIVSDEPTLINTEVMGDIVIKRAKKSHPSQVPPVLQLKGKTNVRGNITFEGIPGEIHLYNNAKLQGQTIKGKVIHK